MSTTTGTDRTPASAASAPLDVETLRAQFPALQQTVHGKPLIYLDNAATTQKPQEVLDALQRYYVEANSNVHRGVHELSVRATEAYEGARVKVQRFIGAPDHRNIVFVRGTTEAINLVAHAYARPLLGEGDEVLITHMEHHSNIVPWQIVTQQTGATLKVVPIDDRGQLMMDAFEKLLSDRTKIVAVMHVSNALGTINPIDRIIELARGAGATVVIDGAQAAPHVKIDVAQLDCDFYAFSGHKLYGPTGIGALYGRGELLDAMGPYQGGGEMIKSVTFEKTIYNDAPAKFEAGTPNIAGAVGLGAAIDFVERIGLDRIAAHEHDVLTYGTEVLMQVPQLQLIGTAENKAGAISFVMGDVHPHDIGTIVDSDGIAIRTGHHCAQPVMDRFGIAATARASIGLYNTRSDLDALAASLQKVNEVFK